MTIIKIVCVNFRCMVVDCSDNCSVSVTHRYVRISDITYTIIVVA